ncbi:MAG TPA: response regulator [Phycisphaerales bacterium]|jgi:CheY-like chemotaxis protein|nr:response regulator [Phycisphaerales bacterium]
MANILVVEDDATMNQILVETLEDQEHTVRSASDEKEAVSLAHREEFDLAISDVRLPGKDGVETLTELKKIQKGLKCIIITGYATADTPVRAIRLQVDDYLFKPFSLSYFLGTVDRVLAQEGEQAAKFSLFQKLFSVFSKLKSDALKELVAERQEAFRGLYLGTRSGYLSKSASHEVYAKLEALENGFRGLLNNDNIEVSEVRSVHNKYVQLSDRLAQLEFGGETSVQNDEVPMDQFEALYEAIKSSHIGLDDLQYAPLLRKTPDARFEAHQKLLNLKHQLWPNPVS